MYDVVIYSNIRFTFCEIDFKFILFFIKRQNTCILLVWFILDKVYLIFSGIYSGKLIKTSIYSRKNIIYMPSFYNILHLSYICA